MTSYHLALLEQKAIYLARRLGIRQLLGVVGLLPGNCPIDSFRGKIVEKYIKGCGIEIGALNLPTPVRADVRVFYVDRISKAQAMSNFPALDSAKVVKPDVIADGFLLDAFADESQDFVIGNHILEHCPDPLGALSRWFRVLKPNGFLFMAVPNAAQSFDRGRKPTSLDHMIEDRCLYVEDSVSELYARNLEHYKEWGRISQPAIEKMNGAKYKIPSEENVINQAELLAKEESEIHFHTFSASSYKMLLTYFAKTTTPESRLLEIARNGIEIMGIVQKGS